MPEGELESTVMHATIGHTIEPPALRVEITDDGPMRTVNVEVHTDPRDAAGVFVAIAPHVAALSGGQS